MIQTSALSQHENQTHHRIKWSNLHVFQHCKHPYRLLLKRSSLMDALESVLNKTRYSVLLILCAEELPRHISPDLNGLKQNFYASVSLTFSLFHVHAYSAVISHQATTKSNYNGKISNISLTAYA
jgi:hypothetical protein